MRATRGLCWGLLAALAAATAAGAQDAPLKAPLTDPTYLPPQGQIFNQTTFAYTSIDGHTSGPSTDYVSRIGDYEVIQHIAYGITDRLSVNADVAYEFSHLTETEASGSVFRHTSTGFEDPTFGAAYRVLRQDSAPISLDATAAYTPDLISAKNPTLNSDGTVAFGGSQVDAALAVGRLTRHFTIQARAGIHYFGGASSQDPTTSTVIKSSDYWQPYLALASRTWVTSRLSLNGGFGYYFAESADVSEEVTGVQYRAGRGDYGQAEVSANYRIIPGRLVATLAYKHDFFGRLSTIYALEPDLDTETTRSGNVVEATFNYAFR